MGRRCETTRHVARSGAPGANRRSHSRRPVTPQQQVGLIQQAPDYYTRAPGYGGSGGWRVIWNTLMRTPVFVSALVMVGGLVALLIVLWLVKLF